MRTMTATPTPNPSAARRSIEALALGDAFGERWFPLFRDRRRAYDEIRARAVPEESPWPWTDDTAMALGVLSVLNDHGKVDQPRLAQTLADTFLSDPGRGYGSGMHELLPSLAAAPTSWPSATRALFGGEGSLGNGAAMRVAPLGAWFSADPDHAAEQARRSAEVTHAHPQGIAGAVAVAVAASLTAGRVQTPEPALDGSASAPEPAPDLLARVADRTPPGPVRDGLIHAIALPPTTTPRQAADLLGSGRRIRADDTVPFALWCAARHQDDLIAALWATAEGLGDVDTTCAIVGGVVGAGTGVSAVPAAWLGRREPLPAWVAALS
ncbi:putative hydrolase [Streptomyces bingchenggensis BCW-1]|uniref:Putative hydrolase n=1 Tax=Streptomyces bingchenggensis (strain BCW-1) TaxID=749414 RepID=D7CHC1_STRBB|nr:putative hydrolase [Streptomyces bingchenggensis BCW-1]